MNQQDLDTYQIEKRYPNPDAQEMARSATLGKICLRWLVKSLMCATNEKKKVKKVLKNWLPQSYCKKIILYRRITLVQRFQKQAHWELEAITWAYLEVNICEDLIVEHEGEPLLDGGLSGLPVIEGSRALVYVPHVTCVPPPRMYVCRVNAETDNIFCCQFLWIAKAVYTGS